MIGGEAVFTQTYILAYIKAYGPGKALTQLTTLEQSTHSFYTGFILIGICSLPKIIELSSILSNVAVDIVTVRINAIKFIFFEANVRPFEIRIAA